MHREAFEVIVSVSSDVAESEDVAIAEASRYLAYADQTDTFGGTGRVFETHVYGGPTLGEGRSVPPEHQRDFERNDWGISLHFTAGVANDKERERFFDELDMLAHAETYQQLAMEVIDVD